MTTLNLLGRTLGRFEIVTELGRGGMGVVYRARQTDLDRTVAIKVLPPELTHDKGYVARFQQEARSAAHLEHPNIVPIYEIGTAEGLHYLVMKYIQGRTLKEVMAQEGAMSVQRATTLIAPVGAALDYAHQRSVIHRDIKPSNIMVTNDGWVYLTDFGLARGIDSSDGLTKTGTIMGTPEYMSPEQAQGLSSIGPPTDIYALGIVLYEMLTGKFPFESETPLGMLSARLTQTPRPLRDVRNELAPAIEDVVMRSLVRDPSARYSRVADMIAALHQAPLVNQQPVARADTPYVTVAVAHNDSTMLQQKQSASQSALAGNTPGTGVSATPPSGQRERTSTAVPEKPAHGRRKLAIGLIVAGVLFALVGARHGRDMPGILGGAPTPTPITTQTPLSTALSTQDAVEAELEQGWDLFDQDQYEAALDKFDSAMKLDPENIDAYFGKSYVYRFQETPDYDEAIAMLLQANDIDPDDPYILLELGWSFYERGMYGIDVDDYREAEEYFEETLMMMDDDDRFIPAEDMSDAYTGLGWSIYNQEEDYDDAEEAFEEATELYPHNSEAFYGLGMTREELDDSEGAMEAYEMALDLDPEHEEAVRRLERLHYER